MILLMIALMFASVICRNFDDNSILHVRNLLICKQQRNATLRRNDDSFLSESHMEKVIDLQGNQQYLFGSRTFWL